MDKDNDLLKQPSTVHVIKSHDTKSIYPDMRPLTREDFESDEDYLEYQLNQWFGHLSFDIHLD